MTDIPTHSDVTRRRDARGAMADATNAVRRLFVDDDDDARARDGARAVGEVKTGASQRVDEEALILNRVEATVRESDARDGVERAVEAEVTFEDADGAPLSPIRASARRSASESAASPEPRLARGDDVSSASFRFTDDGSDETDGEDAMSFESANFSMAVNMTMDTNNVTFHSVDARSKSLDAFYEDELAGSSRRFGLGAIARSLLAFAGGFAVVSLVAVEILARLEDSDGAARRERSLRALLRDKSTPKTASKDEPSRTVTNTPTAT